MFRIFAKTLMRLDAINHDNRNIEKDSQELSALIDKNVVVKITGHGELTVQYYSNAEEACYEQRYYVAPTGRNLSEEEYVARRLANSFFVSETVRETLNLATKDREVSVVIEDEYAAATRKALAKVDRKKIDEQEFSVMFNKLMN